MKELYNDRSNSSRGRSQPCSFSVHRYMGRVRWSSPMIVSKFKDSQDLQEFGLELVSLFNLTADDDGRYATSWGPKTVDGLARTVERLYRERVYGEEELPADEKYYVANVSGEDPQWPKPIDKTSL